MPHDDKNSTDELARQAELPERGIVADFWEFLKTNKKWWITPVVVAIVLLFVLITLGNSSAAPFIYSLF